MPIKGASFLPGSGLVPPLSHHSPGPEKGKGLKVIPPALKFRPSLPVRPVVRRSTGWLGPLSLLPLFTGS
jgi:hypothetical protein